MNIQPVTLTGTIIQLAPLTVDHVPDLTEAGQDENIWTYMPYGFINSEDKMRDLVDKALEAQKRGSALPFAVIHLAARKAIGMTCYLSIEKPHRNLEIGGTWYSVDYQRTGVNTECKFLLLRHAFETLRCFRVQLKTDLRNVRSQAAIERLGAVREGVLRDHMILPDGTIRSSVFFSILAQEWPAVKLRLLDKLS